MTSHLPIKMKIIKTEDAFANLSAAGGQVYKHCGLQVGKDRTVGKAG